MSLDSLYRKKSLEKASGSSFGEIILDAPVGYSIFTWLVILFFIIIVFLVFAIPLKRTIPLVGHILPLTGQIDVNVQKSGVLAKSYFSSGNAVHEGDLILEVWSKGDHQFIQKKIKAIEEKHVLLLKKRDSLNTIEKQKIKLFQIEIQGLSHKKNSIQNNIETQFKIISSLKRNIKTIRELVDKGTISKLDYENRLRESLMQEKALNELKSNLDSVHQNYMLLEQKIQNVGSTTETEYIEIEQEIIRLNEEKNDFISHYYAAKDGTLFFNNIVLGQSVLSGKRLFSIVPLTEKLSVELLLPSQMRSQISVSQKVEIELSGFSKEVYGSFKTDIKSISATAILPQDYQGFLNIESPAFIVKTTLPRFLKVSKNTEIEVQSGMAVQGYITLPGRTIYQNLRGENK